MQQALHDTASWMIAVLGCCSVVSTRTLPPVCPTKQERAELMAAHKAELEALLEKRGALEQVGAAGLQLRRLWDGWPASAWRSLVMRILSVRRPALRWPRCAGVHGGVSGGL